MMDREKAKALEVRYHAFRRITRSIERCLAAEGITHLQYQVLVAMYGHPSAASEFTIAEVCQRLYLHPNSVGELLHRMERKGLVSVAPLPADRRQMRVSLTPLGVDRLRAAAWRVRSALGADFYLAEQRRAV